jgi:hypothetical protein
VKDRNYDGSRSLFGKLAIDLGSVEAENGKLNAFV